MTLTIKKIANFKEIFGNINGGRILDVACGAGQFIEILQDSLGSWEEMYGLDVDDYLLAEVRHKFSGDRFRFVKGDSQQIPFPDNTFDLVSLSKGLHHISNPELALQEMKRVVNPEGYIVINEMYADDLTESQTSQKIYHHLRVELDKLLDINHFYTFQKNEIISFVKKLNLSEEIIFEYLEDQSDPMNETVIDEYSDKMDSWLDQIRRTTFWNCEYETPWTSNRQTFENESRNLRLYLIRQPDGYALRQLPGWLDPDRENLSG